MRNHAGQFLISGPFKATLSYTAPMSVCILGHVKRLGIRVAIGGTEPT
jgi:hypothetical protein